MLTSYFVIEKQPKAVFLGLLHNNIRVICSLIKTNVLTKVDNNLIFFD